MTVLGIEGVLVLMECRVGVAERVGSFFMFPKLKFFNDATDILEASVVVLDNLSSISFDSFEPKLIRRHSSNINDDDLDELYIF